MIEKAGICCGAHYDNHGEGIMIILRIGSKGDSVRRLQTLLKSAFIPPRRLFVDGDFGKLTEALVILFQVQNGLAADGVVGPITWTALGQKFTTPPVAKDLDIVKAEKSTTPKFWMDIAKDELGVSENALPGQHNQRIVGYHETTTLPAEMAAVDETAWCSSFVNWVIIQAGYKGTNSAAAKSWIAWGSKSEPPTYGAVTVIKNTKTKKDASTGSTSGYHVGFLVSKTSSSVTLLGGNQGDQVKRSTYPSSNWEVIAHRVP